MNNLVTYYMYYLKDTKEIYAYTDEKEKSNMFCMQRNLDMFYYKKVKMDKESIHNLAADGEYRSKRISIYTLDTFNDKENRKDNILLAMPEFEYITVTRYVARFSLVDINIIAVVPYKYLKPNIRKYLDTFHYKELCSSELPFDDSDVSDIINKYYFGIDEFNIFLKYFGKTMMNNYGKGNDDNK